MSSIIRATTTSGLQIAPDNSGSLQLQTNGTTTAVTIDTSQNVGIGTTTIGYKATAFVSSEDGFCVQNSVTGTGSGNGFLFGLGSDSNARVWSYDGNAILFGNTNTERMRIDSSGNVLVGTTTATSSGFIQTTSSNSKYGWVSKASTTNGAPAGFFNLSGTEVGSISTSASATSYATSSDYRLKENIVPMTGALDKVAQLKPVTYTWKNTDGEQGEGFIAHELAEVCPFAVIGEKDAVNEDGSIKSQAIDTSFLVATLTAAIQELKAIVDAQAIRIETLEDK